MIIKLILLLILFENEEDPYSKKKHQTYQELFFLENIYIYINTVKSNKYS
jgi:hypothetical protein